MEAGRGLDATMARRLWKAIVVHDAETKEYHLVTAANHEPVPLPLYSTVVEDAHRVASAMQKQGWTMHLRQDADQGIWLAAFIRHDGRNYTYTKALTMPHAVCLAALDALDGRNISRKA